MASQTVFVTGATGFIGTHLVGQLLNQGHEVRCLVRPNSAAKHLPRSGIERVAGTLDDPATYRSALAGCETVFHLGGLVAATRPADLFRVNGTATARLADACAAEPIPPRIVYVSSLAAAGPPLADRAFRDESDPPTPISVYGESKRAGEIALQQRASRLPVTIVRPGIVFGERDPKVAAIFKAIARTGLHFVVGFQTPRLSLIHVDDLLQLLFSAASDGETIDGNGDGGYSQRGYYLACDDREHPTYWQFGRRVAGALDRGVVVWPLWRWVGRTVGAAAEYLPTADGNASALSRDKIREATAWSWACSSGKARSQLAFAPALPLDDRLRQTADWLRSNGGL